MLPGPARRARCWGVRAKQGRGKKLGSQLNLLPALTQIVRHDENSLRTFFLVEKLYTVRSGLSLLFIVYCLFVASPTERLHLQAKSNDKTQFNRFPFCSRRCRIPKSVLSSRPIQYGTVLSRPISSLLIPSRSIPSHLVPSHPVPFHPIPSHRIPSCAFSSRPIPSHPISSHPIPSDPILPHPIPCRAVSCRAVPCRAVPCRLASVMDHGRCVAVQAACPLCRGAGASHVAFHHRTRHCTARAAKVVPARRAPAPTHPSSTGEERRVARRCGRIGRCSQWKVGYFLLGNSGMSGTDDRRRILSAKR